MKRYSRHSVLVNYLLNYLGFALSLCLSMGVLLFFLSARELETAGKEAQEERLSAAAENIAQQIERAKDIALEIKITNYYQTHYLNQHVLPSQDLLAHFERFRSYAPTIDNYYLYYVEDDVIYSASARYTFWQFLNSGFFAASSQNVQQLRDALCTGQVYTGVHTKDGGCWLAYPFDIGRKDRRITAVLLYYFNPEKTWQYLSKLYQLSGDYSILIDGNRLLGSELDAGRPTLTGYSDNGLAQCTMYVEDNALMKRQTRLETTLFGATLLAAAAALALAVLMARRNYTPIRKIAAQVGVSVRPSVNEVESIENALKEIRQNHSRTSIQLDRLVRRANEINSTLRQYLLLLLFNGVQDEQLMRNLHDVGVPLSQPLFQTAWLPYNANLTEGRLEEALAGDGGEASGYVLFLSQALGWALLVNGPGEQEMAGVLSRVDQFLAQYGIPALCRGPVCSEAAQVDRSFARAVTPSSASEIGLWEKLLGREELQRLLDAIGSEGAVPAEDVLVQMLAPLTQSFPTHRIQRALYKSLSLHLIEYGAGANRPVPQELIEKNNSAADIPACQACIEQILAFLCAAEERAGGAPHPNLQFVLRYIDLHAMDADICMQSVTEACGVTARQVNNLLREQNGITFRDYLCRLRMERAVILLNAGTSISETAYGIGYSDVSYFIRAFRKTMRCTPGQYQAQHKHNL